MSTDIIPYSFKNSYIFFVNCLIYFETVPYNILRMLGQEIVHQGKAPSKRIVSRKRIRTVIKNVIHFAGHVTKHARQLVLSVSRSNAWVEAYLGLTRKFSLA